MRGLPFHGRLARDAAEFAVEVGFGQDARVEHRLGGCGTLGERVAGGADAVAVDEARDVVAGGAVHGSGEALGRDVEAAGELCQREVRIAPEAPGFHQVVQAGHERVVVFGGRGRRRAVGGIAGGGEAFGGKGQRADAEEERGGRQIDDQRHAGGVACGHGECDTEIRQGREGEREGDPAPEEMRMAALAEAGARQLWPGAVQGEGEGRRIGGVGEGDEEFEEKPALPAQDEGSKRPDDVQRIAAGEGAGEAVGLPREPGEGGDRHGGDGLDEAGGGQGVMQGRCVDEGLKSQEREEACDHRHRPAAQHHAEREET